MQEMWVWSLGGQDPWRRKWQPTPNIPSWEIPWTEEPGRLQSMGSQESQRKLSGWSTKLVCKGLPCTAEVETIWINAKVNSSDTILCQNHVTCEDTGSCLKGRRPWCSQRSTIIATGTTAHRCSNSSYPFTEHLCARNRSHLFHTLPHNYIMLTE